MQVIYPCCCGLDVHKKTVVACLMTTDKQGKVHKQLRTFDTMTKDLLELADWLKAEGCTHLAMESTGSYWKPIYNLLEGQLEILVVNAHHVKAVPGRKTDIKDAEWLADLLRHGLLRPSFIPSTPQRHLRDLTRFRTHLIEERARMTNRLQTVLEDANIKLASVVSDVRGVSARAILEALIAGERNGAAMAELAKGRLRSKREVLIQAIQGRFTPHHAFLLSEQLACLDNLEDSIERTNQEINQRLLEDQEAVALLDTIPGVGQQAAQIILAEIGSDMSRFPSAKHLAAWAGMCPANAQSGGRRVRGGSRKGNVWLKQVLVEIAHVASKTKNTYLSAQYRRIAARRGKKRALIAVGHSILVMIYHILKRRQPYQELGAAFFEQLDPKRQENHLVKRLERLGFEVTLQPLSTALAP